MRTPFRYGNRLFTLAGQLLIFPALKDFIADVFGYGWDRNRAIDTLGTHNNALMGGYLLAASNTVISIAGILTTDTIKALTKDGLVGTVTVNGTVSFSAGNKYGAFEVYRRTALIGRYCLTERQGLQIINQVTVGLPNGLLGGTTTTVWQRSNAFYCETNHTGYSISGTGWVTSTGSALTVGTIIPADPLNPTKCMAWVSGVQQDLQFVGKAKNSVSVVPIAFYCNYDRYWGYPNWGGAVTSHEIDVVYIHSNSDLGWVYGNGYDTAQNTKTLAHTISNNLRYSMSLATVDISITNFLDRPIRVIARFNSGTVYIKCEDLLTRNFIEKTVTGFAASYTVTSSGNLLLCRLFKGKFVSLKETLNGTIIHNFQNSQVDDRIIDTKTKTSYVGNGVLTNLRQNIDCVHLALKESGYELWYNGTDYLIYPLADDGTTIVSPAGYTSQGKVTAGNMPSVADSRMSTFKYTLANSYALRQSVPEAYNTDDQATPKLLTYSELSALSANPKVIKTEANGKITNIKIK